jgi:hypothetical protein
MVRSDGESRSRPVRAARSAGVHGQALPLTAVGSRKAATCAPEIDITHGGGVRRLQAVRAPMGAPCRHLDRGRERRRYRTAVFPA